MRLHGDARQLGVAVSGGPDSLALLLLASAAFPGRVRAATVDHALREASGGEAHFVAEICKSREIPHSVLHAEWETKPAANIQASAREKRYDLLADWAGVQGLTAVMTAHHADDQAETILMRLARGAGLRGLAGIRPARRLARGVTLIRPLLHWTREQLLEVVDRAGITPIDDPSNADDRFDRTKMRSLVRASSLDAQRLAQSASNLRDANEALDWAVAQQMEARVTRGPDQIGFDPHGLPPELVRRMVVKLMVELGAAEPSGPDLSRAMTGLAEGETRTLAGLKLSPGPHWRISRAPPRTRIR
ncbi:MAG: tRNA lysidine(34) synthetase TilS [Sphingomicrobium sp.]